MFTGASPPMITEGGKKNKADKPEEWTNKCHMILKSMQEALSVLYEGLETDEDNLTDVDKEQNKALQGDETIPQVAKVFTQHCQSLVFMMSEPTNGPVRLPLGSVLRAVSRCLRVSYADVRSVPSMSELAASLSALHKAALEIVSQLVLSCKTNLLPRSRVITDLCLQALASARNMETSEKSKTAACAYQALILIVQKFGWGLYLTHKSKSLIQELIADIKWQNLSKQTTLAITGQIKQEPVQGNKKKGKKKKNKAESYSDLAKANVVAAEKNMDSDVVSNVEATVGALELLKLMLGRVEFVTVESLMRSVLDTTQKIQHEPPPSGSPYTSTLCRRLLYSAVFACSCVKLDPGCGRKDAVTHFQMTNLALNLLKDGMHSERCHEVRDICKESVNIILVTGNLNRPVIRRIQPDENNATKDVTELEREVENIRGENENLQKRLIDSEMESQSQKRLIASFRKEIESLKECRTERSTACGDQKVYLTDPTDYELQTDTGDEVIRENEFEKEESDEEVENQEEQTIGKFSGGTGSDNLQVQPRAVLGSNSVCASAEVGAHEKVLTEETQGSHSKLTKRKYSLEQDSETPGKKRKSNIESSINNNNSSDTDSIQNMISDFVDADPDAI